MGSIQNISSNTSDSQTEGQSQSGTNIRFQMIDFVHYTSWLDKARYKQTDCSADKTLPSPLPPDQTSVQLQISSDKD